MKLKRYNRATSGHRKDGAPLVSFETKGVIRINRSAAEALSIGVNDRINIVQDEDSPRDWYIEKTKDEDGLVMRDQGSGSLCCNSVAVVSAFMKTHLIKKSVSLRIATQPALDEQPLYAILWSSMAQGSK